MKKQSEFGKGLTYNLGLFLAHADRAQITISGKVDYSLWFNGAADHLYEIEVSVIFKEKLKKRISKFQSKCLNWRLSWNTKAATQKDFEWAINEAKTLLIEIDKTMGIDVIKASWE